MRRNKGYGYNGVYGNYMPYGNIVVNNTYITNITNVSAYSHGSGRHLKRLKHHDRKHEKREEPPKLYRFCASCGLLDQDVAASLNAGELLSGGLAVARYGIRGAAKDARDIIHSGRDLGNAVCKMGSGLCGIVESVCGFIGSIL